MLSGARTNRERQQTYIFDARPLNNARANAVLSGGYEDVAVYDSQYSERCRLKFCNIDNIHAVLRSFSALEELCSETCSTHEPAEWLNLLSESRWFKHIAKILRSAREIATVMIDEQASVLIHCSDGWDRTPQLCALVALMLDEWYRTIDGFLVLVEKEWCGFGHMFSKRCGHAADANEHKLSPVFVQWIDCVWQLTQQFPTAFEFDERLLVVLCDLVHCGRFGNFLLDSEKERAEASFERLTHSSTAYLLAHKHELTSPIYERTVASSHRRVLLPSLSPKALQLWRAYYLRWDSSQPPLSAVSALRARVRLLERQALGEAVGMELERVEACAQRLGFNWSTRMVRDNAPTLARGAHLHAHTHTQVPQSVLDHSTATDAHAPHDVSVAASEAEDERRMKCAAKITQQRGQDNAPTHLRQRGGNALKPTGHPPCGAVAAMSNAHRHCVQPQWRWR